MLTAIIVSLVVGLGAGWFLCSRYGSAAKALAAQVESSASSVAQAAKKL